MANRAAQAVKKGKPLIFHWRGGYLTRDTVTELLNLMEEAARQKGKHVRAGLNWPQAVFFAEFTEVLPAEELLVETANEGEVL